MDTCTAFEGARRIASGALADVALQTKPVVDREGPDPILIFDDSTGRPVEVDFRGTVEDVRARLQPPSEPERRGPGRPRLGVVAREVTLLPRHWEWLNSQPGGASVALRKLVEEARRANQGKDRLRQSQEAAYRFMSAMAGNLPGFEEASRALFAGNAACFGEQTAGWPADIRDYAARLAEPAL
ncbi:MAG: DUF2239 family protein [Armatimonadetes bacterium]|nr:DUF2239 family protein [Armatimonadota bacterium]